MKDEVELRESDDSSSSSDQEIFSSISYKEEVDIIMHAFIKRIDKALKSTEEPRMKRGRKQSGERQP